MKPKSLQNGGKLFRSRGALDEILIPTKQGKLFLILEAVNQRYASNWI